jgi:hypothetical protein
VKVVTFYDVHDFTNWTEWPLSPLSLEEVSFHDSYLLHIERKSGTLNLYLDAALIAGYPRPPKEYEYIWPVVASFADFNNERKEYSYYLSPEQEEGKKREELKALVEQVRPEIDMLLSKKLTTIQDHCTVELQGECGVGVGEDMVDINWIFQCSSHEIRHLNKGTNPQLASSGTLRIIND